MNDDELRELQERVEQIKDMTEMPGWSMLLDAARHALIVKQTRIVQGKCADYEEYKTDCAFGDGIEYLMMLPTRLQESLERELGLRQESVDELEEVI